MSDKLRDDPMWRDRLINFVHDALRPYQRLSPLSGYEQKVLDRIEDFRAIDKELPDGLYMILTSVKNYVTPFAALKILLYWYEKGDLNVGYEILYYAARDELALSEEEIRRLIKILNETPGMNVSWVITMVANPEAAVEHEEPYDRRAPKRSDLKLPLDFS